MARQVLLSVVLIASAPVSTAEADLLVNTETTSSQADAAVAMGPDGSFVVVWSSYGQDGSSNGVFAQCFDPNCGPIGDEFQVNTETGGNQTDPAVAAFDAGGFVVAWHGPGPDAEDIFAQAFGGDNDPLGQEFPVNTHTTGRQRFPRIATSGIGSFVVVWESEDPDGEFAAAGRLYDASGVPLPNELTVNTAYEARYPDAAMDSSGNFVIVWMQDRSTNSIMARLYDKYGIPRASPFEVSGFRFRSITRPAVAADAAGNFVVTWDAHPNSASSDDIYARWYEADGTAVSDPTIVNTTRSGAQQNPRAAMAGGGELVVVWHSDLGDDYYAKDVFAQRYSSPYTRTAGEFQLNSYSPADQKYPAVGIAADARLVAAWQSAGQDGSGYGIFATGSLPGRPPDFSGDGFVNFIDYATLADQWLAGGSADLVGAEIVDGHDLAEFCRLWLTHCDHCSPTQ